MPRNLRLAIVGCGDIARYVAVFGHLAPEFKVTACCDRTLVNAQRFAKRYRIPRAYEDFSRMLDSEVLDAIYLAVPHDLHAPMLRQTIERDLPTLVEKPITRTLAEGVEITNLIEQTQVKVGVNYQYRYDPACYKLAHMVQAGALGEIYSVRCNLAWHREQAYFSQASWHSSIARAGGGTLITQASHLLDVVLWACNQAPIAATGVTATRKFRDVEIEDIAQGSIELADGTLVQVSSTMNAKADYPVRIEVYGELGSLHYANKPWPHLQIAGNRIHVKPVRPWGVDALQSSLRAFGQWVLDDSPYLTPAQAALPVLAAVGGLYRAAQLERKIYIAPLM